jgi:hypothetical protein
MLMLALAAAFAALGIAFGVWQWLQTPVGA